MAFNKTVATRYRIALELRQYAPAMINLRLAAVRRLAYEAASYRGGGEAIHTEISTHEKSRLNQNFLGSFVVVGSQAEEVDNGGEEVG